MSSVLTRKFRALLDSIASSTADRLAVLVRPQSARGSELEMLEQRTLMSTYYVSSSGKDTNSGTSASSPWASIARANSQDLQPGDSLLFQGGSKFTGQVTIGSNDSGSSSAPVTVGSYGSGKATIYNPSGRGVYVLNASYINVQNLAILGAGPSSSSSYGIKIENNSGGNATYHHVYVDSCDISGFSEFGIYAYMDSSGSTYDDVRITNTALHNNAIAGFYSGAVGYYGIENLYIGGCDVYGNPGFGYDPNKVSGSGINVGCVNGGTIEHNLIHDNGVNGNGGCGCWSFYCNDLTVQYNESYDNHTNGGRDGDGFDFDVNTSNSVMQYNYSHDNDGNGYQLNNWMDDSNSSGDIIRFNISQNNGRKNNYGGLEVWGKIINSSIYNNTVYMSPSAGNPAGISIENRTIENLFVSNLKIDNNVIVTSGGRPMINISSDEMKGASGLSFDGNVYYSTSGSTSFIYGSKTYSSLGAWQAASGQEMMNGKSVGYEENPGLASVGTSGTVGNTYALASSLTGYKVNSSSPIINHGVSLSTLGLSSPGKDFYGNSVPSSGSINIGADQHYVSGGSTSSGGSSSGGGSSPAEPAGNPAPWSNVDIGSVGKSGKTTVSGSSFTVTGSGADIFGTADAFQYEYQTLNGDGSIIAEVNSVSAANAWAKAGVMIRDGNSSGAKEVSMLVSPNNGEAEFERRWGTNGDTGTTDVSSARPAWVKLVRSGNNFTASISKDGKTWTTVGTTSVTMNATVEIGLAVTSHDTSNTAAATFSNVSVVS